MLSASDMSESSKPDKPAGVTSSASLAGAGATALDAAAARGDACSAAAGGEPPLLLLVLAAATGVEMLSVAMVCCSTSLDLQTTTLRVRQRQQGEKQQRVKT
jgi:hypothetical protein